MLAEEQAASNTLADPLNILQDELKDFHEAWIKEIKEQDWQHIIRHRAQRRRDKHAALLKTQLLQSTINTLEGKEVHGTSVA